MKEIFKTMLIKGFTGFVGLVFCLCACINLDALTTPQFIGVFIIMVLCGFYLMIYTQLTGGSRR